MRHRPFIEAFVDGAPVGAGFYQRLSRATITDAPGQDGDTCSLTFDDAGNAIAIPPEGARLDVRFGFRDEGSFAMGRFVIEKAEIEGGSGGEQIVPSGRAADMRSDLKEPVDEHFDDASIGDIVSELARRHGHAPKVAPALASRRLGYLARFNQSTMDFLTRLADRHGALFSIKDGKFLFLERGQLAPVMISREMCESWSFSIEPRPRFGTVEAGWFERETGKTRFETASTGLEGPVKRLRTVYADQAEAAAAARAESGRGGRATGAGSITLAGMPEIMADIPITLTGFRPEANGLWRAGTVTHSYDGAYTTAIALEAPEEGRQLE